MRVAAHGLHVPDVTHAFNLTNGVNCNLFQGGTLDPSIVRVTRIQSTQCEQKQWSSVLNTLGPEFFATLARTQQHLVFHDRSERDRYTRALWQGVPWIMYAVTRTWYPDHDFGPGVVLTRQGRVMNVGLYWDDMYRSLPERTLKMLRYYGNTFAPRTPEKLPDVHITDCHTHRSVRVPLYIND